MGSKGELCRGGGGPGVGVVGSRGGWVGVVGVHVVGG